MDDKTTMAGVRWLYQAEGTKELGVVLAPEAPVALGIAYPWQMAGLVGDVSVELDAWGWQLRDGTGYKVELLWEQVMVLLERLPAAWRARGTELERARWRSQAPIGVPVVQLPRPVAAGLVLSSSAVVPAKVASTPSSRHNVWREAAA
jgi:hypothetical protein